MISDRAVEAAARAYMIVEGLHEVDWRQCDREIRVALEAALPYLVPPPPQAPQAEGWKLVPTEPTEEMIRAGYKAYGSAEIVASDDWLKDIYRAMLSATPPLAAERGTPLGYVNIYRREDHDEVGGSDLYKTVDEARAFNAAEFDDGYLGIGAVTLVAEHETGEKL